jgi:hypothetical protein
MRKPLPDRAMPAGISVHEPRRKSMAELAKLVSGEDSDETA